MNGRKLIDEFQPGRGYTKEQWDEVTDPYESTDEELAQARPFREVFPDLAASIDRKRKPGRPKAAVTKVATQMRFDRDVVEAFKADGPGWQTRINNALRQWLQEHRQR